jgi:16S rRNA G966 N2-methylase RsmD
MKITDIKIGTRFRRDLGNVDDLVQSIEKNGLLSPLTVTKEGLLIDGARRLEAYRILSIPDIPVHIVDIPIKENGEIDANLVRKDFTVEELLAIKKYRESIEPDFQGKRTDLVGTTGSSHQLLGNFPRGSKDKRRQERIAENTGLSYKSLDRLEEITYMEKEHPELGDLTRRIDSGRLKINKAWGMINTYKQRQQLLTQAKELNGKNLPSGLNLMHGDCRHKAGEIDNDSIDLIFTDPPYDRESLPLYVDLGKIAARVLKPGGSLVAYIPHHAILDIGNQIMQPGLGLKQAWTFCVRHTGHLTRIASLHLLVNWKPLVWLVKGDSKPNVIPDANFDDFILSAPPDKSLHQWAQSITEAQYIIKHLTVENQTVLDCFMGSGTTGIAAISNKRRFIGIEIDHQTFDRAKGNLLSHNTNTSIPIVETNTGNRVDMVN